MGMQKLKIDASGTSMHSTSAIDSEDGCASQQHSRKMSLIRLRLRSGESAQKKASHIYFPREFPRRVLLVFTLWTLLLVLWIILSLLRLSMMRVRFNPGPHFISWEDAATFPTWGDTGVPRVLYQTTKHLRQHKKWRATWDRDDFFFRHFVYDNAAQEGFMKDERNGVWPLMKDVWDVLRPIEKADAFRYAVVYRHGGFYADIDVTLQTPIPEWSEFLPVDGNPKWYPQPEAGLLPLKRGLLLAGYEAGSRAKVHTTEQMNIWFFAAAPGHPVIWQCLQDIVKNRNAKFRNLYDRTMQLTGPVRFTNAVHHWVSQEARFDPREPSDFFGSTGFLARQAHPLDLKTGRFFVDPERYGPQNEASEGLHPPPHVLAVDRQGDFGVMMLHAAEAGAHLSALHKSPEGLSQLVRHLFFGSWK